MQKARALLTELALIIVECAGLYGLFHYAGEMSEFGWHYAWVAFGGLVLFGFLFSVGYLQAYSLRGTVIAIGVAALLTSPIFIYVWMNVGWPLGGFTLVTVASVTARCLRDD